MNLENQAGGGFMKNMKEIIKKNKNILIGFLTLAVIAGVMQLGQKTPTISPVAPEPKPVDSLDTFIPKGFVLLPLEISNAAQLPSLIGDAGVIDLYYRSEETKKSMRVAARIKVVQAPYNPEVYAALVKETESHKILAFKGPFFASVQNPHQQDSVVTEEKRNRIQIDYQN